MQTLAFVLSSSALLGVLLQLVIWGLILWVLWWAVGKVGLPEPFGKIATVVLVVITVIILLNILLGLGGQSFIQFH